MTDPQQGPLAGKVALVTGASSGIGAATARLLGEAGAAVAVAARRRERLEDLAQQMRADGAVVLPLELDVADEAACTSAVQCVRDELGGLDVLVNNAGLMLLGPIVEADTEDWRRMLATNVLGLMYLTHAAVPGMVAQGSGDVVQMSSVAGRTVNVGSGVYNASKHAVNAFSESLRQEVTTAGVRVTLVEPGVVDTELTNHITHEETRQGTQEWVRSMRSLTAEDIARGVLYAVTQPSQVSVNEVLLRPTDQQR